MDKQKEETIEIMKQYIKEAINDTAVIVKNSTEKTNSNLVGDLKNIIVQAVRDEVKATVPTEIRITVNGKIDAMKEHLNKQDITLQGIHEEQVRVKEELKLLQNKTQPIIESRKTVLNVGRFVIWAGSIMGALAAILLGVGAVVKFFK